MSDNSTQVIRSGSRSLQSGPQTESYVIRQGDQVQISVWGYPEFNTTAAVKEGGVLAVPLLGEVVAAGLAKGEFTEQLRQRLSEYLQGEVKLTVSVISTVTQKVAVLGSVFRQGSYPLTTDASLIDVLSTAGGTTAESDLRHIRIFRGEINRQPIEVDLTSFMESGNTDAIPLVRPGDSVYIPKRVNVIRELSDFMRDAIFLFGFFQVFN